MADKIELDGDDITVNGNTVARVAPDAHVSARNALEEWFDQRTESPKSVGARLQTDVLTKLKHAHPKANGLYTRSEITEAFEQVVTDL